MEPTKIGQIAKNLDTDSILFHYAEGERKLGKLDRLHVTE